MTPAEDGEARGGGLPACSLTRKGRARARAGHPWVYRDDLASAEGEHGDVVFVESEGAPLGTAFLSVRSKIALRWIERGPEARAPDPAFWRRRLQAAAARREALRARTNAYRVVHDAADGFPGLVVDRYGPVAVVQSTIAGMDRLLADLAPAISETLGVSSVVARNDAGVREQEGLERYVRVLAGEPPERVWVYEEGPRGRIEYPVDPLRGQKTGAFLDQRENRFRLAELARGRFLDAFSHVGVFSLHAARAVSEAVLVDSSAAALAGARAAAARNGFSHLRAVEENVFDFLKAAAAAGERFDAIALDPPAFAKNRSEVPAARRGYREINRRAMGLLERGGILGTSSCSYNLSEEGFLSVLRDAAAEARAEFRVIERRGQAEDHPVLLSFPESAYLKFVVLEKL
ncbi:MAG: class I SAM-dependent rRNA methyltransferase [Planctomycetota bacterium]